MTDPIRLLWRIDLQRIGRVFREEFVLFRRDFDKTPVAEEQDLRSLLISWFAVFLPEAFAKQMRADLREWVSSCRERSDFDDTELQERMERNLEFRHGADVALAILVASNGPTERKRKVFSGWHQKYTLDPTEEEMLKALIEGQFVPNPLCGHFGWVQRYVAFRLACVTDEEPEQMLIDASLGKGEAASPRPKTEQQTLLSEPEQYSLAELLWRRMSGHPLASSTVRLLPQDPS